jgi:hypothetical protein
MQCGGVTNDFNVAAVHTMEGSTHMTIARRMVKKAVQRGRSKRKGEAYSEPYVEPLNDARTKLAGFSTSC